MGVSQARISQITKMNAVRAYIEALGGTADVVAHAGDGTNQGSSASPGYFTFFGGLQNQ